MKIWWFCGFIGAYVLFFVVLFWVQKNVITRLVFDGRTLLASFVGQLINIVFVIVFIYLNALTFDPALAAGMIFASGLSVLFVAFLVSIVGVGSETVLASITVYQQLRGAPEWREKMHAWTGQVALVLLPLLVGYLVFTMDIPSSEATRWITNTIVITMAFLNFFGNPLIPGILSSKDVDDDSRAYLLSIRLGEFIFLLALLSLVLWRTLGISTANFGEFVSRNLFWLGMGLGVILVGFVLLNLVPYFRGRLAARRWNETLLASERILLTDIVNVLSRPSPLAKINERLREISSRIDDEIDATNVNNATELLQDLEPADPLDQAMARFGASAPRFRHIRQLEDRKSDIAEMQAQLAAPRATAADAERLGNSYARVQAMRLDQMSIRERGPAPLLVPIGSLATAVTPFIMKWGNDALVVIVTATRRALGLP